MMVAGSLGNATESRDREPASALSRGFIVRRSLIALFAISLLLWPDTAVEIVGIDAPGPHYMSHNYDESSALGQAWIVLGLIFFYETVMTVNRLLDRNRRRAALHALIALVAISIFFVSAAYRLETYIGAKILKVHLFPERHAACAEQAVAYEPGKKFGICERRLFGSSFNSSYFYIVFDSDDEVARSASERSTAFKSFAEQYQNLGPHCDFTTRQLRSHFYLLSC